MSINILTKSLLILFLSSFSACSLVSNYKEKSFITSLSDAKDRSGKAPIEVQIKSASKERDLLKVEVTLKPFTKLNTKDVAVALVGLSGDKVVEKQSAMLDTLVGERVLEKSEKVDVEFVLSALDLTDYQVKCSWGQDAQILSTEKLNREHTPSEASHSNSASPEQEALIGASSASLSSSSSLAATKSLKEESILSNRASSRGSLNQEPKSLQEEVSSAFDNKNYQYKHSSEISLKSLTRAKKTLPCATPPCDFQYVLHAVVENNLDYKVDSVSFGVGLYWKQAASSNLNLPQSGAPLSENEEKINRKIELSPGEFKKVTVEIDRAIPSVPGGEFIPHLRVLDAN